MSNVKLTLRPPPNVDFVHGFPGIPPGQDRPQAFVKGAIEVRTPPSGVKALWVRIELRKVETLPGGGDSNTFYDYVGPGPVTVWRAPDGYNLLRTQDFPFSIRIPESIPPTIVLEGRAGIHYELVATVCTKGKRVFLRKRKNIVTKEIAQVIIDKHELHSTWPVYCQPEQRQLAQEGVILIVERSRTCYGPGDRISLVAVLKSDSLHTVILRGFEMMLKESTVFRAHTFSGSRKTQPTVKTINVAEARVAINATLYGGTMHQAELVCQLPVDHATTTLNAARHIDVTYVLSVKALMGTGTHVTMELPVIISNWHKYISQEAIRRIGTAPALSLVPPSSSQPVMSIEPASHTRTQPITTSTLPSSAHGRMPSATANQFSTVPASNVSGRPGTGGTSNNATADEFGYGVGYGKATISNRQISEPKGNADDSVASQASSPTINASTVPGRRPNSARASNPAHRFTIMNAEPDVPEESLTSKPPAVTPPARNVVSPRAPQKQWPTAEEEKRAFELARSKVAKVQGTAAAPPSAPTTKPTAMTTSPPPTKTPPPSSAGRRWLSAEEEKVLLYEKAQAAVTKVHRDGSDGRSSSGGSTGGSNKPSGSELYQQALTSVNANPNKNQPTPPHVSPLSGGSRKSSTIPPKVPHYLTAEQEKEALKRYQEAKMAVDRVHNPYAEPPGPAPIAYDSLYPRIGGTSSATADAPPPFEASVSPAAAAAVPMSALAEKAMLAGTMRTADAAPQNQVAAPPPSFNTATTTNITQQQYMDAAAEKQALREKLEAKDAAAAAKRARQQQQRQQQRNGPTNGAGARPTPTPPTHAQILTAADEKAMLKAKFETKDAKATQKKLNGHVNQRMQTTTTTTTPPPPSPQISFAQQQQQAMASPPPLMPRPPAEYIQETQEEDARVSKVAIDGASLKLDEGEEGVGGGNRGSGGVYLNGSGNVSLVKAPGPPPPLPPKPAGE